jgi:predicted dehydrogenase
MIGRMPGAARLVALADPSTASVELARQLGIPHFHELSDLLAAVRPDGVVIASPNALHVPHALACVEAGVPSLVEKPVADSVEAGERLFEAASKARIPILVGHHRLHSSIMTRAAEVVRSGVLGRIVAATTSILFYKPDNEGYYDGDYRWRRDPGGGPILMNLIHEVGSLRALCGEITAVQAFTSNATRGFAVEDSAAVALRFESGALGTVMVSDTAASDRSWEHTSGEDPRFNPGHTSRDDSCLIAGTMGSLSIPTMRVQRYLDEPGRSWHKPLAMSTLELEAVDPLEQQMAHFVEVIRGLAEPRVTARDGLQNLRVVEAVAAAARSGRVVEVSAARR